jgi:hypothetical protein
MGFTEDQLLVASDAWAAARKGGGLVLKHEFYPAAHDLAEAGWLSRRFEPDGEMSWWWKPEAELTLDVSALMRSTDGRVN